MAKKRVPYVAADLIVANAPDPVFVCDPKGKILVANNAVTQLFGLKYEVPTSYGAVEAPR